MRTRNSRYKCEYCEANLDPGERCNCRDEIIEKAEKQIVTDKKMKEILDFDWEQIELKFPMQKKGR